VGDQRSLTVTDDSDLRRTSLCDQRIDRTTQLRSTVCKPGTVVIGEADRLLAMEGQYLG